MNPRGKVAPGTSDGAPRAGEGGPPQGPPRKPSAVSRGPRAPAVDRATPFLRGPCVETSSELFSYIFSLPAPIPLSVLGGDLSCCCAFRTLSSFDRHVLLRLLPLQQSVSERAMRLWVSQGSVAELRRSLQRLTAARFILTIEPPGAAAAAATAAEQQQAKGNSSTQQHHHQQQQQQRATQYALNPAFQKALLQLLLEGPPRTPLPFIKAPPREAFPSKQQLLLHSQRKWEQLLRYVVGASEGGLQGSSTVGGPSADLLTVLRRKSLLCQETSSRGSFLQQQQQQALYGGTGYLKGISSSSSSSNSGSSSSTHALQAAGAPEYTMAKEAFSWLLKDLKAQVCSLLLEFLYLVDGGLLSNAAHEAAIRRSSSSSSNVSKQSGRRAHGSSNNASSNLGSSSSEGIDETPAGASAALVEERQREMQETLQLLTALIESCVGQPFSLPHLTPAQRRLLDFCVDLGVVWMPSSGALERGAPVGAPQKKAPQPGRPQQLQQGPSSPAAFAFAAPYVLLIRRDAYSQKKQQTAAQGTLQRKAGTPAAGAPQGAGNTTAEEQTGGGPPQSDAASVMEGPFHPWVKSASTQEDACEEGGESGARRASAFRSLGLQPRILVETNFKVYMYTSSPLHTSVLAHLCELTARLPNLVIGLLTRASVLGALKAGITAEQIIGFLEAHAHEVVLQNKAKFSKPLIPENVAIQLRMWQQERQRLVLLPAVVFKGWDAALLPELFQRSVRWAVAKGCAIHYTMWPEDQQSPAFEEWLANEKYLAVHADSKPEICARIREIRDELLAQRRGAPLPAS
ncbi:hypothetical protein Efla_004223 [Eimeria flavescens]